MSAATKTHVLRELLQDSLNLQNWFGGTISARALETSLVLASMGRTEFKSTGTANMR